MAYAGLDSRGPARTLERYRQWVKKLATREYADELVILAVALQLQIRIICVPYTVATALAPWNIATYDLAQLGQEDQQKTIALGNNDVHFVYLSPFGLGSTSHERVWQNMTWWSGSLRTSSIGVWPGSASQVRLG